jgi:hypothetical protein
VTVAINKGLVRDPLLCDWLLHGERDTDVLAALILANGQA